MADLPQILTLQVRRTLRSAAPAPVHDLRVAIRRYNQALALDSQDRNKPVRRLFKQTMELAGEVRNLDIAIKLLGKMKRSRPIVTSLKVRRRKAAEVLKAHLRDSVETWLADGFKRVKPAALRPPQESLTDAVHRLFKYARKLNQAKQLHRLRIAAKKLRYTLELIHPDSPKLVEIKQLQSELGRINDFRATRAILKTEPHAHSIREQLKRKQRTKMRHFRSKWSRVFSRDRAEETWIRDLSKPRRPAMRESGGREPAQRIA